MHVDDGTMLCQVVSPQVVHPCGCISNVQMKQSFPLTLEVIGVADDDHLQQVGVGDVGGPQRHHQVPEADERAVPVGEDRHDHVVLVVRRLD